MSDIEAFVRRQKEIKDLETIPVTRGQLRQLLIRVHVAEGMPYTAAEIRADMSVAQAFIELRHQ